MGIHQASQPMGNIQMDLMVMEAGGALVWRRTDGSAPRGAWGC